MVMKGDGVTVTIPPSVIFTGTTSAWAWTGIDGPGVDAQCSGQFSPTADPLGCIVENFFQFGSQVVAILPPTACSGTPNDYPPGTEIEVDVHFNCGGKHYDCYVPTITIHGGTIGYQVNDVAIEIKNKLQMCFDAIVPGEVIVTVNQNNVIVDATDPDCFMFNAGGTVKIKPVPPC